MTVLVNPLARRSEWFAELTRQLPDDKLVLWPDRGDPAEVEFVVAWVMPRSAMKTFTNLRAVLSLGAGTEQWQKDGMEDIRVVRLADPEMSNEMAAYALHWVLHFQREFVNCAAAQSAKSWDHVEYTQAWEYPVGILGYGTIGALVGQVFKSVGFPINAWSRSGGSEAGVTHYTGVDELEAFLGASRAVVNVLPSTPATARLLDAQRLAQFAPNSVLLNMGRGTVLDESALIVALDSGPLRAAVLDVTNPEPPVSDSPLWSHAGVHLTPHVAGSTHVRSAAKLVVANIHRIRNGQDPFPILDRARGY